ncbi:ProQ/FINO family protein [Burkholderia glumae]|uniref:ProQ/FINO family protein n=1 Tax=Burkholderia glumae TaxID=337 RepID=UPI001373DEE8|nr:ProQ/FINO family protein [Burkholderia glumae]MCR1767229.1 ProQ activator of osmoprotectant transporter prop [Burkholderia glumae]QHP94293.1 ProQ activator of osmoprotectant transporter prop [Burkholderia glumae]QJP70533.1 ProQ activator of osmoprotectant transporter prop [Burkholderia glumae]
MAPTKPEPSHSPRSLLTLTRSRPAPAPAGAAERPEPEPRKGPPPKRVPYFANRPPLPVEATLAKLQRHFPVAFPPEPAAPLPLCVRVQRKFWRYLAQYDIGEDELDAALAVWCSAPRYVRAIVEGATRVDPEGRPAGRVPAANAVDASERLRHALSGQSK